MTITMTISCQGLQGQGYYDELIAMLEAALGWQLCIVLKTTGEIGTP